MYFTSLSFILFLIAVFLLYYTIPKKLQWMFLLLASMIFYALSRVWSLIYICATIVTTWFSGQKIGKLNDAQKEYLAQNKESLSREEKSSYKAKNKKTRKLWLVLCLLLNFGMLAVIKYTDFVIFNINGAAKAFGGQSDLALMNFILPLGISFYTFRTMSYVIDVYWGKIKAEKNVCKLGLFTSFFPQILQGPISRYGDLSPTLFASKKFDFKVFSFGCQRIIWGFFKKLVIADRLLVAVKVLIGDTEQYYGIYSLLAISLYAVTLYCDFTGGIDITIGIGNALGIEIAENFDRPFFSKNIFEYWRRWHITMGVWFKDYLFYPISVSKPMLKLSTASRKALGAALGKRIPVYITTIILWFMTGIWHGASWNFIVWGLTNGVVIIISQELMPLYKKFHDRVGFSNTKTYNAFMIFRTFWLMSFIRSFDIYVSVPKTFQMFWSVFTDFNLPRFLSEGVSDLGLDTKDYIVAAAGLLILFISAYIKSKRGVREWLSMRPAAVRCTVIVFLIVSILIFGVYGIGFNANQFIYNQF